MKKTQSSGTRPDHQKVAGTFEFKSNGKAITIGFTDQQLSPPYRFQALVTSLPAATHSPLAVWRYYNGRADCENVIKELQAGFALPTLCLEQFWASEAALSLDSLTYNLTVLFQRHLGWQQKVTLRNLRFWLFVTAGVLSHPAGKTTVKLAVPKRERAWWRRLWEKILSPFPNCNAVENQPTFSRQSS